MKKVRDSRIQQPNKSDKDRAGNSKVVAGGQVASHDYTQSKFQKGPERQVVNEQFQKDMKKTW